MRQGREKMTNEEAYQIRGRKKKKKESPEKKGKS